MRTTVTNYYRFYITFSLEYIGLKRNARDWYKRIHTQSMLHTITGETDAFSLSEASEPIHAHTENVIESPWIPNRMRRNYQIVMLSHQHQHQPNTNNQHTHTCIHAHAQSNGTMLCWCCFGFGLGWYCCLLVALHCKLEAPQYFVWLSASVCINLSILLNERISTVRSLASLFIVV